MSLSVGLLIALLLFFVPVMQALVTDDVRGWLPHVSRAVARLAARTLPEPFRSRYEEEWPSEVAALKDRRLSAFGYSVRVLVRAGLMRRALHHASAAKPVPPSQGDDAVLYQALAKEVLEQVSIYLRGRVEEEKQRGRQRFLYVYFADHTVHADLPDIQAATDESLAEANSRFFDLLLRDDGDRWHAVQIKLQRSHRRQD